MTHFLKDIIAETNNAYIYIVSNSDFQNYIDNSSVMRNLA